LKPAVSSKEWFEGKDGLPPKVSMESLYEGEGMKEVEEGATPAPQLTESVRAPEPVQIKGEPKPVQTPITLRDPPPSVKEQGGSVMVMADKFTDHDAGNEESSDASSFEEVQRPAERTSAVKPSSSSVTKDEAVTPAGNLWQAPQETERGPGPGILDKVGWSPYMIIVTLLTLR
jgi:coronin-1B/1C/6